MLLVAARALIKSLRHLKMYIEQFNTADQVVKGFKGEGYADHYLK